MADTFPCYSGSMLVSFFKYLGGRGKTKARLACDVISVFLAMISLDGAQLLQQ